MTIHVALREALAVHDIMRSFGFAPDDIFLLVARVADPARVLLHKGVRVGDLCIHVQVKAQGLEYTAGIGICPVPPDQLQAVWSRAVLEYNAKKNTWDINACLARTKITSMGLAMVAKGFVLNITEDPGVVGEFVLNIKEES